MHDLWTVQTGYNLGTYQERVPTTITLPVSGADTITTIAGTIPPGLRLSGQTLIGTPFQVSRSTKFEFCLRAKHDTRIQDRTFTINIEGPDAPTWITPAGTLPIGADSQLFILDSSYVDFQLEAQDADLSANTVLEYYIPEGGGELPPGLTLSTSGKISGLVDPIRALDILSSTGYYDSNDYASAPFDFGLSGSIANRSFYFDVQEFSDLYNTQVSTRNQRKLNRYYNFKVNVTDGDTTETRTFKIFVVGDDFLRADNTIMQLGTGVFTSDGTYLRTPQWLTPTDLGFKRANNYVTIFLELYDPNTVPGKISYILENTNDDNTDSIIPPGMTLDAVTGEIAGRVPYQPAVNKEYKFTVSAVRAGVGSDLVTVVVTPYEDQPQGGDTLKIQKLPVGEADGLDDLESLVGEKITINKEEYTILGVDGSDQDYELLTLNRNLTANDLLVYTGTVYNPSEYSKGIQTPIVRANNEIFVYNRISKDKYKNRTLRIGSSEYIISDIQSLLAEGEPALQGIASATAMEKLILNIPLTDNFVNEQNISIAAFKDESYSKNFLLNSTDTEPTATKTFTVKVLGEVDSTITWTTASALGTLKANLTSHLRLEATSTVTDAKMKYLLMSGSLPPGLSLSLDGEIVGNARLYSEDSLPGITSFDDNLLTLDGATTTVDESYSFTVKAQDRFGFSSVERTFTLVIDTDVTKTFTDLYAQPLLKSTQRNYFKDFISNTNIFAIDKIYRPNDSNFGLQKTMRMLVYSGIEKKVVGNYVTAVAKNHKRARFNFGDIKTAVAKYPGTNNIAYELVYADVVDVRDSKTSSTRSSLKINPQNKIKINQTQLEVTDDSTKLNVGGSAYTIFAQAGSSLSVAGVGTSLEIFARTGRLLVDFPNGELLIDMRGVGPDLSVGTVEQVNGDPFRFRPKNSVIKVDSNLLEASMSNDELRYISNISNMRNNIKSLGTTEGGLLPLWMRTAQTGNQALGYTTAVPLCYCKEGTSQNIALAVKNSGFDIKNINFEIDRYIVEGTEGNSADQYILFPNYQYNV
jgi:hypothetical protein